jgi:catechol 2,3-dioxygenase-like lactoylglutathione lyase family enzyme
MASAAPCVQPRGVHHAGLVVSDLAASIAFYGEMFGAKEALFVRHEEVSLALLELPNAFIELLAYSPPGRSEGVPRESDLGAGHFALLMDDVVDAPSRLEARGVAFIGPPERIRDGPSAGYVITFCLDPDGNRVELIQQP